MYSFIETMHEQGYRDEDRWHFGHMTQVALVLQQRSQHVTVKTKER
jgi:hypothetical protein